MPLLDGLVRGAGATMLRGKFLKRQGRRGVLSPKRGNKDYYKGKGGLKPGVHTKHGGYRYRPEKMIDYRVPDLSGFHLKPYVASNAPLMDAELRRHPDDLPPLDERFFGDAAPER
mmetsp:Transcript_33879/g.94403  ORF Transcript_33879/g.94403 Transcript_33879/m.94403 type:complete len:115 (-) Transcript_33879:42-386(-)